MATGPRKDEARMTVARCCTHSLSDVAGARSAARAQHELDDTVFLVANFLYRGSGRAAEDVGHLVREGMNLAANQ